MLTKCISALMGVLLAALLLVASGVARADVAAIPPVVPAATKILILPTLDTTADRPEMQQEHIVTSDHRLAYEFLIRGFAVQAPDVAVRAARTADIDLTAPDERTRKSLKILGQSAGATWVVALTVTDVGEVHSGNWLGTGGRRAKAKVEIRIWDVAADAYITNKFYEDTKSTKRFFGTIGTTGLFRQAVDTTVQRSVQDILTPYPVIKHLQEQFDETDVVSGEAASGLASGGVSAGQPVLAAGTPVTVVLQSMLRSDVARDGDPVMFHVKEDVYSTDGSHTRFIAKDAVAMGRVVVAKERGYAGKAGSMQFTCDYALLSSGKRVYLRRDRLSQVGRSNQNGAIALTLLAGQAGLLLSGRDAKFDAGTPFMLYVDQDTALTPGTAPMSAAATALPDTPNAVISAAPAIPMTLFTMADGSQIVGRLVSFDGTKYAVTTTVGNVSFGAEAVKSMNVLASTPIAVVPAAASAPTATPPTVSSPIAPRIAPPAAVPAPAAASAPVAAAVPIPVVPALPKLAVPVVPKVVAAPPPVPKPAPRLPVISKFPQPVRVTLMDGTVYVGSVTSVDDGGYCFALDTGGILNVDEARVKTLEFLPAENPQK